MRLKAPVVGNRRITLKIGLIKWLLIVSMTVIVIPIVGYFVYDLAYFQSRRVEISGLVAAAEKEDRAPPSQVVGLLMISLNRNTSPYTARLLMRELNVMSEHMSMLHWHFTYAIWGSLVALHLSEQDRISLISSLSPTGVGKGLNATARLMFGRSLSDLSLAEAATVVALTKNPTSYGHPDRLARDRDWLLSQYGNELLEK